MSPTTALDQTTPSCSISAPATAYQYRYQATSSAAGPSSQTLPLVDESSVLLSSQDYVATPCPDCGQIIRVSSCTSYHMNKHRESQRCRKAAERRAMHRETAMATALRTQLFHNHGQRAGGAGTRSDRKYAEAGAQTTPTAVRRVSQWLREVRPVKVPRRSQSEPPPVVFIEEPEAVPVPPVPPKPPVAQSVSVEDASSNDGTACYQCGQVVSPKNTRNHVGGHVLRSLLGAPEAHPLRELIHAGNPCGFCGHLGCEVRLVKTQSPASTYAAATSNCSRAHNFSLNKARRFSTVMPCTNFPLHCALCPKDSETRLRPVYWKYNVFHHIQTAHPEHWNWTARRTRNLPKAFRKLLSITQEELDVVAPGYQYPYPGPVGDGEGEEDVLVVSNKRAAVEALLLNVESASKRVKEA